MFNKIKSLWSRKTFKDQNYSYSQKSILSYLHRQVHQNRNDLSAYILLGQQTRLSGDPQHAYQLLANLLSHRKLSRSHKACLDLEMGFCALDQAKHDLAIKHFNKALSSNDTSSMAHLGLFKSHQAKDDATTMLKHLEYLLQDPKRLKEIDHTLTHDDLVDVYLNQAQLAEKNQDFNSMYQFAKKAWRLQDAQSQFKDPQSIEIYFKALCHRKKFRKALDIAQLAFENNAKPWPYLDACEDVLFESNKYNLLKNKLSSWNQNFKHIDFKVFYSKHLCKLKHFDEALELFEEAYNQDSKHPHLLETLTALYQEPSHRDTALQIISKVSRPKLKTSDMPQKQQTNRQKIAS